MAAEPTVADVQLWADELDRVHRRIAPHFRRQEPRERVAGYLEGLLSTTERKNGWQVAEYAGEATPFGMQRLLQSSRWDAEVVRDELREYVVETLGGTDAVVVVDETGFLKKGKKSAGVQRQYSGTAGRIENCQIGVFLAYATTAGHALIDRELYLPQGWLDDHARCDEAGIPASTSFHTKPRLAQRMLERLAPAGIRPAWVTGDEVYGGDRMLLLWLETHQQAYVMAVKRTEALWYAGDAGGGPEQREAVTIAARLPETAWQRLSVGDGAKGPRLYDWAETPLARWPFPGWDHHLVVRRSLSDPTDLAFYVAFSRHGTTLATRAWVAGRRWVVEECFEAAKGETGLDHYEVRRYDGWYRHITLSMLALAILVAVRAHAAKGGTAQQAS